MAAQRLDDTMKEPEFQVIFDQTFYFFGSIAAELSMAFPSTVILPQLWADENLFKGNLDGIFRTRREVAKDGRDNSASGIIKVFGKAQWW